LKTQGSPFDSTKDCQDGWLIQQEDLWSRRAPGNTCLNALAAVTSRGAPANNDSKGCGTVMRVAPIGLLYDDEQAYQMGRQTSELTHGHPTASISAGVLCQIISQLREEFSLEQTVLSALKTAGEKENELGVANETSEAIKTALSLAKGDETPSPELIESLGAAWVAEEALAISIYCALVARDFSHGVLLAVNHSGDSDSTGAITGNLLGLIYGQDQLPEVWRETVELKEVIAQVAHDLVDVPGNYFPDDDSPAYCAEIFQRYPGC
jgi:ADP-ribosylglycohydrolase